MQTSSIEVRVMLLGLGFKLERARDDGSTKNEDGDDKPTSAERAGRAQVT